MTSHLLFFPRIIWPQCFKNTAKFGGLATIWRACAPPPAPSVDRHWVRELQCEHPHVFWTDWALTDLVLLQPINSWRWRAWPMSASSNWVDLLQVSSVQFCSNHFILRSVALPPKATDLSSLWAFGCSKNCHILPMHAELECCEYEGWSLFAECTVLQKARQNWKDVKQSEWY